MGLYAYPGNPHTKTALRLCVPYFWISPAKSARFRAAYDSVPVKERGQCSIIKESEVQKECTQSSLLAVSSIR